MTPDEISELRDGALRVLREIALDVTADPKARAEAAAALIEHCNRGDDDRGSPPATEPAPTAPPNVAPEQSCFDPSVARLPNDSGSLTAVPVGGAEIGTSAASIGDSRRNSEALAAAPSGAAAAAEEKP